MTFKYEQTNLNRINVFAKKLREAGSSFLADPPGLTHFAFQYPSLDSALYKGQYTLLATNFISSLILSELIDKRVYNSKSVLVLYISLPARNTIEECVWFIFGRFIPAAVVG